jgi:hypothetical protein
MRHLRLHSALLFIALLGIAHGVTACPACYSGDNSPAQAGMNWAIFAMLGITGTVLLFIVVAALFLIRRARLRNALVSDASYVNEEGDLCISNTKGIAEWNSI